MISTTAQSITFQAPFISDQLGHLSPCCESLLQQLKLFDSVNDLVLVLGDDHQVLYANNSFRQFFNRTIENVQGLRPGDLMLCEHALASAKGCGSGTACQLCGAAHAARECINSRTPQTEECTISRTPEIGEPLHFHVKATPFQCRDNEFTIIAFRDIGDEKRRRSLESIFFHDIMNLAGGMNGLLSLLPMTHKDKREEIEAMLQTCAERLVDEINSQRSLSTAESGELEIELCDLTPRQMIDEVVRLYAHHTVARQRTLQVKIADEVPAFTTDKTLLGRILGNLVKNALEASSQDAVITLGCEPSGNPVLPLRFWVHNEGCIPRRTQLQIFTRAFSTKGNGRGLGTYSVRLLGEKYLRGRVSFTSTEAHGTTFQIDLPLSLS